MKLRLLIGSIARVALLLPATTLAEDACNADIRGQLMRKEGSDVDTKFVAKVTVTVRKTCTMVNFDLVVVEQESGGETFEIRVAKRIRVRDSTASTMKLNYKLSKDRKILSHRFEQTGCQLCE
jgi:hypothetical protein